MIEDKFTDTLPTTFIDHLKSFFDAAIKTDLPLAIWKLPATREIKAICQLDENQTSPDNLESAAEGFLFSPFKISPDQPKNFISADIKISSSDSEWKTEPSKNIKEEKIDTFLKTWEQVQQTPYDFKERLSSAPEFESEKEDFIQLVNHCKKEIGSGNFQKAVPSRRARFELKKDFHPVDELIRLTEAYENAFVSLVYLPDHGLWLGATPEVLISVKNNKTFETVSLAGTQVIPSDFDLSHASWTQKEIEEQALVSRYIINCFKKIRLREFDEYGPKTVRAGNLIHLKTIFKVDMDEVNFPELGSVMLNLLHPTSAICGMPLKPTKEFLEKHEGFNRSYFSGFLGPVNIDDQINIFVNLRCCQIHQNGGVIFAGAGVTEDSEAISEWKETEMKFQTLLSVIL